MTQAAIIDGKAFAETLRGKVAVLAADIDLARRILADQHHGEACLAACGLLKCRCK